jgi:hypothetical protein
MRYIIILTILLPCLSMAQEDSVLIRKTYASASQTDKEYYVLKSDTTIMNGPYIAYHYNGKVFMTGRYRYGVRDGEWRSYHENGTPESITNYREGQYCKTWQYFSYDGKPESSFDMDVLSHSDTAGKATDKRQYISVNIDYPVRAQENDIEGTVEVMVVTDSVCHTQIQLLHGIDSECDAAAIKGVRKAISMIDKYPCRNGMWVMPVVFKLNN